MYWPKILFGLGHLTGVASPERMVPNWMPFDASVWVVVTGIAFVLAGLAILAGTLNILAARLLALMLLIFEITLVPSVIAYPRAYMLGGERVQPGGGGSSMDFLRLAWMDKRWTDFFCALGGQINTLFVTRSLQFIKFADEVVIIRVIPCPSI